jgi:hypothetical protein
MDGLATSVSAAALMRDTIARTVHSILVVNTPLPGRISRTRDSRALARPRGMYRYVTPTGKVPLIIRGSYRPGKLAEEKQNT